MKLRNLFYLLLALPLVFAACSEDTTDPTPQPQPDKEYAAELTLTSEATMEFAAEGGEGVITYTAKMVEVTREGDVVPQPEVEATCEAAWVENLTVSENITFTVAVNEGEARETKIVVTYSDKSFEVAVKQAAKQGDDPVVEEPVLTLTSDATMEFAAEGGAGEITYTLENAQEGVELTAECVAGWVTDLVAGEKVTFAVAANEGDARDAKIVVAYGAQKFEVVVKQEAKAVVPQQPTEFVPVKVKAMRYSTGNFLLNLFVNDSKSHVFDIYDEVNPNDLYLSDGTYTSEDGTIGLADSEFYNGSKSVGMESAELTLTLNEADWTMTIEGEFVSTEGQAHTINWTGVVEGFSYPGQPADFPFSTEEIVRASTEDGLTWNLIFFENNAVMGNPMTRITVQLAEANKLHITDGTYTLANGGIVAGGNASNGSFYRYTREGDGGVMTECELTVAIDKDAATAKLSGYFVAAGNRLNFEYNGAVDGFRYVEAGEEGIVDWKCAYIYSQWKEKSQAGECSTLWLKSNAGDKFELYVKNFVNPVNKGLGTGTYEVDVWNSTKDLFISQDSKANGAYLKSGNMVIEMVGEDYKITFNFVDESGTTYKGVYEGDVLYTNYTHID
ncbi:MAG: BACON domain-containing protein [Alistipes sp.]|nr:BACON domain-containing protein [Alistipes sp.]